ncbi:MAG: T9SS type A sorting domain-containing protein, partial [Saprospiraceae bacterium]|nr:T9SS type A sorting domain-containing protein [Saprospiraceae bacterium]
LSSIDIDPSDPQHLLIAFSNYGIESVWESTNGGASWSSIQGDLPDFPVRWAIFHPLHGEQAFLATEMGVWSTAQIDASSRSATAWVPDNEGLANVRCDMIRYRVSDFTFVVATHGRGLYTATLQVDTMTTLVADQSHESFLPVWPNPATDFVHIPTSFSSNRLIHLAFRNVEGRYLSKEKLQVSPGEILRMPVPAAAIPGIYLITLDDGQEVSTQKLLVN